MGSATKIEWADMTFNPFVGCTRVGPGCDHCYAEAHAARFGTAEWGPGKPRHRTSAANWRKPLAWNAQHWVECMSCGWRGEARKGRLVENPPGFHPPAPSARACPGCGQFTLLQTRARVFCSSLADVFDNEVPDGWRQDLFELIGETPNLDWLLLTKRIGNVPSMVSIIPGWMPPNIWLGATVVNQTEADRDIPKLLATPAAKRFLSIEPMLGPVDIRFAFADSRTSCCRRCGYRTNRRESACPNDGELLRVDIGIDWVIVGGESGPHARPMHPDWVRSLRDQLVGAGVPFFFKQWGEWGPAEVLAGGDLGGELRRGTVQHLHAPANPPGHFTRGDAYVRRLGKKAAGRLLDARTWDEVPK